MDSGKINSLKKSGRKTKKFTILHSNDMHGDFFAEINAGEGKLIGGLSLLSGYINKVRSEEKNVLYVISGDMVQGSIIDTEYKGISTIKIMNYLAPDVVALGNHEFDYGLPHLLFLEKMANFPIVSANLYINKYHKRLMTPYKIIKKDGFEFLFTGIITDKILDSLKQDALIGSFVTLEEASKEVGKIVNAYKNEDIDQTIILSHIGYESDIELAKLLDKDWGVDMIIGGHSHTILEKPTNINGILIAQAGVGTNQIGRFDIIVDDATNSIIEYKWRLVQINEGIAKPDQKLSEYIDSFKKKVDSKYSAIVSKLSSELTHQRREEETPLGNLIADAFKITSGCDIALVGSGSIRVKSMGSIVTLMDLMQCFPYDDNLTKFTINGRELKNIFSHIMRKENRNGEGECYQVSSGISARYSDKNSKLISISLDNTLIDNKKLYSICLQGYHVNNCKEFLNITDNDLRSKDGSKVISTSAQDVLEEYLRNNQNIDKRVEKRLQYI